MLIVHVMAFVLLAAASSADAAVSLFFDDRGNLLPGRPVRQAGLLSAKAAQGSVPAGINLPSDVSYTFFPVTGKTFSDVVQSVEENAQAAGAPVKQPAAGLGWAVGLSFDYDASTEVNEEDETVHATLKVRDVRIDYIITVTLPMLLDNTALNPVEQDLWKGYVRDLVNDKRARIEAMKDPAIQEEAEEALDDITYIIIDPAPAMDVEQTIAAFMSEEGAKIGREMAREVRRSLLEYQKSPAPSARSGAGKAGAP